MKFFLGQKIINAGKVNDYFFCFQAKCICGSLPWAT